MSNIKREILTIEDRYEIYRNESCSHPAYVRERYDFLSNPTYILKYGSGIEKEFKARWAGFLESRKEKEIEDCKKKFGENPNAGSDTSSSGVECSKMRAEKRQQMNAACERKLKHEKRWLQSRFNDFYNFPESHEDYVYYKERFDQNAKEKGLAGTKKDKEWHEYWTSKMNKAYDIAFDAASRRIWREVLLDSSEKHKDFRGKKHVKGQTHNAKQIQTGFDASGELSVKSSSSNIDVKVKVKQEKVEIKQEKDDQVPSCVIMKLLESYDSKIRQITENVQKEFEDYKLNSTIFPNIEHEKEIFLQQELADGTGLFSKELVLKFNDKFATYWADRLKALLKEKIDIELKKVRENWKELIEPIKSDLSLNSNKRSSEGEKESLSKRHKSEVNNSLESFGKQNLSLPREEPLITQQTSATKKERENSFDLELRSLVSFDERTLYPQKGEPSVSQQTSVIEKEIETCPKLEDSKEVLKSSDEQKIHPQKENLSTNQQSDDTENKPNKHLKYEVQSSHDKQRLHNQTTEKSSPQTDKNLEKPPKSYDVNNSLDSTGEQTSRYQKIGQKNEEIDKREENVKIFEDPVKFFDFDTINNEVSVTTLRLAKSNGTGNYVVDDDLKYLVIAPPQITKAEMPQLMESAKREIFNRYMASLPTNEVVIVLSDDEKP